MSKKLDRKDIKNAAWTWMFFHHCAQNFERMQGLAFCHTMSKPLEKLYGDDPEELKAALTRHMQFFNTEPQLGSVIPGLLKQGTSLAVHIWSVMSGEQPNFELACAISIIILIFVLILNLTVKLLSRRLQKSFR